MKRILNFLRSSMEKGQGLVEMAIVAPILIFLLIGVFEVGWALRGYLVLTNVNREVTRFAIRPGYLNYSVKNNNPPVPPVGATLPYTPAYVQVGYDRVLSYTYTTLSDQLSLNFSMTGTATSTMIISHMVIDTGMPCRSITDTNCICNKFLDGTIDNSAVLTSDDLIITPKTPGYEYFYSAKFPVSSTYQTRFDYTAEAQKLARQNNKFNCELLKKSSSTLPSANNVIITEIFYKQPQIFGFPLISNPLTNPVNMYAHTAMRMTVASRTGENIDTVGPICYAFPFTIRDTLLAGVYEGKVLDVLQGYPETGGLAGDIPGVNDRGFLAWKPQWNNKEDLEFELLSSRTSFNFYRNARVLDDKTLSVGDWVASLPGNNGGVEPSLQYWVGKGPVVIPVWDRFQNSISSDMPAAWHIVTFIRVELLDQSPYPISLTSNDPHIYARYIEPAKECINN